MNVEDLCNQMVSVELLKDGVCYSNRPLYNTAIVTDCVRLC